MTQSADAIPDTTPYRDTAGNPLSLTDLRKLLRKGNSHRQYGWWQSKSQPKTGQSQPPRGVRDNMLAMKKARSTPR